MFQIDCRPPYLEGRLKRCSLLSPYISLLLIVFANGCSQPPGPGPTSTLAARYVTITPQSVTLKHGDSWQFTGEDWTSDNGAVTWSVQEGLTGGTVSNAGIYTAPAVEGVYHVVATSRADPTSRAAATVIVGSTGFIFTGSLANARAGHTATLLSDWKVFIGGGMVESTDPNVDDGFAIVSTAELFDPNTGTFQTAGQLKRFNHTATLLQNGDVLFAGGSPADTSATGDTLTSTAELLKAGSGTLQPTGSMAIARSHHTATVLQDGRVLITGGYFVPWPNLSASRMAEVYDPASGTFTLVGEMAAARADHSATLLPNGKVLITGGGAADAELFDPATNSFTITGSTSSKWVSTATLLADGRVLVTGEETADGSAPAASELYDPATGEFAPTGTMAKLRFRYTATLLPDGTVLLAGGEIYVPGTMPGTSFPIPVSDTEIYSPATGSFSPGPTMRQARTSHTATLLPGGSVLFVGGWGQGTSSAYTPLTSAEVYR